MAIQLSGSLALSGSINATGNITSVGNQQITDTSNATSFTSTASLYTDGGARITKDLYVSSSVFIKGNLTIYGTQSVNYITSSQLEISDNIITVNTFTPAVRFGGLAVYDSGSTGLTGSILWDSEMNRWVYSNPSGSTYDGGMILSGPRNTSGLGNEQGTTANYVMKGQGGDHITSSVIYESASLVGIGTATPEGVLTIKGTSAQPPSSGTTANSLLQIVGSLGSELNIGSNTVAGNYGAYLQVNDNNLAVNYPLNLQPNGGNVGIGTSTPSAGLEIITDSSTTNALRIGSNRAYNLNTDVGVSFRYLYDSSNYTTGGIIVVAKDNTTSGNQSGNMQFYTNSAGTVAERMRITSSGTVSIGNTSPQILYSANVKGIVFGNYSSMSSNSSSGWTSLANNAAQTIGSSEASGWSYQNTDQAARFGLTNGGFIFQVSGTGTAGTAISWTDAVTITNAASAGRVGIGTATPGRPLEISYPGPGLRIRYNADNYMDFESDFMNQVSTGANSWQFQFNGSPLMQINSSGKVIIGATSTTYGSRFASFNNTSAAPVGVFQNNNNVSGDTCVYFQLASNARNTSSYYLQCFDTLDQLYIYGNGNVVNRNNSYGTLSDISLKENIVDATPKLNDLLNLKVRNFNLIDDENKTKQIGFVAQEFEEVFPSMVDVDGKSGKKTIKTSVLVPMLVKAIQELEARVKELENK